MNLFNDIQFLLYLQILKKSSLRENLLKLLTEHGEEESFTSSRDSEDILTEPQPSFSYDDYDGSYNNSSVGGEITFMEPEDETNTEMIDVDIVDEDEDIADETLVMLYNEASLKMVCNKISMIKRLHLSLSPFYRYIQGSSRS